MDNLFFFFTGSHLGNSKPRGTPFGLLVGTGDSGVGKRVWIVERKFGSAGVWKSDDVIGM